MQIRLLATRSLKVLLAALLVTLAAQQGRAQDIFGRISGTVTDPSGGVVPKAKITIVNEGTRVTRQTETNDNGYYVAESLAVGAYDVTAEAENFKKTTKTGIDVTAGGRMTVDIGLEVGVITQNVTVANTIETTNTVSPEIKTTIDESQVKNLSLNQRHYESLIALVPGAQLQGSGINPAAQIISYNTSIANVNGQRLDGIQLSVDGGFNLDSGSNNSVFNQVGIDFVKEVDIQTSNYDAEFGRSSSASVNAVTKSGTDQFHGGGFEFVQSNVFNAANAGLRLTAAAGTGKSKLVPTYRFNDYGGDIGGPIWKKHMWFFGGTEFRKIGGVAPSGQATTSNQAFPTAAELTGNFSDILPANVPAGITGRTLVVPTLIPAQPGCTAGTFYTSPNVINPACFTTDGLALAAVFAKAARLSTTGALPTGVVGQQMTFNLPTPVDNREDIVRVDYQANAANSFYFRYLHDKVDVTSAFGTFGSSANVPVDTDERHRPGYNYQVGWVDVISAHLIAESKLNVDWHKQKILPIGNAVGSTFERADYSPSLLFTPPLGFLGPFPKAIPQVSFTNTLGAGPSTVSPAGWPGPGPNYLLAPTADISPSENITWQVRSHTVKFGVQYARNRKNQNSRPTPSYDSSINFSTASAGGANSTHDAVADMLISNFNTLSQKSADPLGLYRFNVWEAYVQDSWKVGRKLTLDLGVRWGLTGPTYLQGNNMTNFDPYQYNVALASTVAGNGALSGNGLCTGAILPAGTPITIECNGLTRPGAVPFNQQGRIPITFQDPTLLAAIPPTAPRGFYQPQSIFSPRIGFAFSPFNNDKTVLRGGFGMFYDKPEGNVLNGLGLTNQPPWATQVTVTSCEPASVTCTPANGSLTAYDGAVPSSGATPLPTTVGTFAVDPKLKVARTYQYSLSIQRETPFGMLFQAAYVGNMGRHLLRGPAVNEPSWTTQGGFNIPLSGNPNNTAGTTDQLRPFRGYTGIGAQIGDVNSNYNSAQITLTKRKGWLTTGLAYTFSKTMGDDAGGGDAFNMNNEAECPFTCQVSTAYSSGGVFTGGSNPVLVNGGFLPLAGGVQTGGVIESWRQYYYGKMSFDAKHIFAGSYTIELPFGKNWKGIRGVVAKGWAVSGITHYQAGAPLTIFNNSVPIGSAGSSVPNRRGSIIPGVSLAYSASGVPCPAAKVCWFNPNAFGTATRLGAGDAPIGNVIGPTFQQWDMTLRKTFGLPWREGMNLQLQADAFNVFNHANWTNPNTTVGSSSLGQITGANPPRVLQLGGKINF